ncbi:MAG TPA: choice-of-anchor D domain-containing protein [Steroidobacteraceae bacterium]|nr:choice-of-anchor D domain-containing protein [Steroidobacteraceae bacterium]
MTVRCRRGPLWSLPFAAVSLAVVGSAAAQTYTVVDLGTLGGSPSTASAINNANQIVGWSVNAEQATRPFLWSHGVLSDLGSLGPNGFAYGINNSGEVAGYSSTPNPEWPGCGKVGYCLESSDEATIWSKGTITGLGTLGGPNSHAYGINDAGQVVGSADVLITDSGFELADGFLYSAGTLSDLGTFAPAGINDAGTIAGSTPGTSNIWPVPTLWSAGTLTTLAAVAPGSGGSAAALSSAQSGVSYVAGTSLISPNGTSHATLWTGGVPTDLGTLPGAESSDALGVNDSGTVVGRSDLPPNPAVTGRVFHATIWVSGQIFDLNTLLDPTTPNLAAIQLTDAPAINARGWIVANDAYNRAYLLVPQLPTLTISPATVSFASQAVGTTSAATVVTLTNTGPTAFAFDAPQTSSDYAQTNDCAAALPAGASCHFNVTFMPQALGSRPSALILGSGSTMAAVSLMGVGTMAIAVTPPHSGGGGTLDAGLLLVLSTICGWRLRFAGCSNMAFGLNVFDVYTQGEES